MRKISNSSQDNQINNDKRKDEQKVKKYIKKVGIYITKKLILILLPVILIMIIISAATWFLFQDEGTWDTKEKGNPSTYTKGATVSGSNGITVDKEDLIKKNLTNMGFTDEEITNLTDAEIIKILQINEKLDKKVTSLDDLTQAEILWCTNEVYARYLKKVEDLEYLLNAELVTQYPKIDNLSEDKLNGIITFERHQVDPDTQSETVKTLKYVSSDEFNKLFENYKQSGKNDIFDYFTLDDSGNAKIATWIREEGKYNSNNTTSQNDRKKIRNGVTGDDIAGLDNRYAVQSDNADSINASYTSYYIAEQSINYKSMIQQYTLPFEYLWSFLVMGESDDFVLKLAQLAYDSEIKIGVYDNIVKTTETNTEKYTEQFRERYRYYEDGSLVKRDPTDTEWKEEKHDYEHVNVVTTYTDTVQIEVMHANTWAVEVTVNYNNTVTNGDGYENEVLGSDEEWDTSDSTYDSWTETTGSDEDGTEETIRCEEYYDKHKRTINKSNTSKLEIVNSTYQKEPSEIKEKTDTDPNTDMNFVKLFIDDNNVRTLLSNPSNVNWLISILENNADTNNMVDLTKYLIYKATNNETFKIDYDFGAFDTTAWNSLTSLYGDSIQEQVWFALKDFGLSDVATAAVMGNIQNESGFDPAKIEGGSGIGFGLCQWSYGRRTQIEKYAASKGTSASDIQTQIEFLLAELTPGGGANGCADYQISSKSSTKYDGKSYTPRDWKESDDLDTATMAFMALFERPSYDSSVNHIDRRRRDAKTFYDRFNGKEKPEYTGQIGEINLSEENKEKMTQLLTEALRIANDDRYTYSQANRYGEFQYDCSSLVYRLYNRFFNISVPGTTSSYGTQYYVGEFGKVELLPGDVVWRSGHVELYIGNGCTVAAKSGKSAIPDQIKCGQCPNNFTRVYRFIVN